HRIQVRQLVPDSAGEADGVDIAPLAAALRPELVQLWYQMALNGRRELPLAPGPRSGFEMILLRMLAFRPVEDGGQAAASAPASAAPVRGGRSAAEAARAALAAEMAPAPRDALPARESPRPRDVARPAASENAPRGGSMDADPIPPPPVRPTPPAQPAPARGPAPDVSVAPAVALDAAAWVDLVASLGLRGPVRELAAHASFIDWSGSVLRLSLPASDDHLKTPLLISQLGNALSPKLGQAPQIRFEEAPAAAGETLHARNARRRDERQAAAESAFLADPQVQRLMQQQGA